jgi:transcriptional antiterminator NusG
MSDATRMEEDLRAAELEAVEAEEAAAATSSAAAEEAEEQEAEEEQLAPEDRARRLFASYLETPEPEEKESVVEEAEEEISLAELLDDQDSELLEEEGEEEEEEAGEEEEDEGEPAAEGRNWFVVHSYSGYENKVKKNLEHRIASLGVQNKIFEVVVPTEEEIELKDGQRRKVERRIFPGYILVDMIMDEDSWYVVRNTPGVTGFVGSIRKPTPLRKRDVDKILKRMQAETPRVTVTFRPGQKVRIADGPFEDFVGTVDEIYADKGKVRILVSFFGRETPVELDFLQVEKIT